jgi:hypothetical protein
MANSLKHYLNYQKFGRTIRIKITCVTKVEEIYMWMWRSEHNYLEKE